MNISISFLVIKCVLIAFKPGVSSQTTGKDRDSCNGSPCGNILSLPAFVLPYIFILSEHEKTGFNSAGIHLIYQRSS